MGVFIAIEGGDGSGKGTQTELICERLTRAGVDVLKLSFPRYGEESAEIVSNYLNGKYSDGNNLHPDIASLPFAIDRYAAKQQILDHLARKNTVVIADRYVASNLAHQGAKLTDVTERQKFYNRISNIEFGILQLPQPDVSFVLLVPSSIAQHNVDTKDTRKYTDKKRDIHEADADHLDRTKSNYEELAKLFPEQYTTINCMSDQTTMRSIEDINEDIWAHVQERIA
ncbi:MAG: hypothetical protein ABIQ64_03150 [Candidatus Saccharimonadales bacterium]